MHNNFAFLQRKKKPKRKLDPSMIGPPANFQHLNHIGSGESGGDTVRPNMHVILADTKILYLLCALGSSITITIYIT